MGLHMCDSCVEISHLVQHSDEVGKVRLAGIEMHYISTKKIKIGGVKLANYFVIASRWLSGAVYIYLWPPLQCGCVRSSYSNA